MNKSATHKCAGWQTWPVLAAAMLFWLAGGMAWGQAANPALAHLVRPAPGTRPLGAVLAELARQSHLPLSYSSSLVPVAHGCTLRPGPARPLGVVLQEILAAEHLSYGLLDGQLVLWPARAVAPVGVTAVNGRPTRFAQPPAQLGTSTAASAAAGAAVVATPTAAGQRAVSRPALAGLDKPPVSGLAKPTEVMGSGRKSLPKKPVSALGIETTAPFTARTGLATRSRPNALPLRSLAPPKQATAKPSTEAAAAALLRGDRNRARLGTQSQRAGQARALASASTAAHHRLYRPSQVRGPVELLPFLRTSPVAAPASGVVVPFELALASQRIAAASPAPVADPARKPFALASLLHPSYLHGEAWVSETLPLTAAVKLGIPRLYAVLGAAVGPLDHPSGWAWGVGVGTAGRPCGRFTPSLDVLHWFLDAPSNDRDAPHDQLTQLRPALAWQLKQGGRWQLVGGPTLNLATGRRPPGPGPGPFRWPLGQHQWLWVNSEDGPSLLRLWPGVQVGLRF